MESLVQLVLQYDPVSDESPRVTREGSRPRGRRLPEGNPLPCMWDRGDSLIMWGRKGLREIDILILRFFRPSGFLRASSARSEPRRSRDGADDGLLLRQISLLRPLFPTRGYTRLAPGHDAPGVYSPRFRLLLFSNFTFLRHTWVCFKSSTARSHTSGTTGIHPTCGRKPQRRETQAFLFPTDGGGDETHTVTSVPNQASRQTRLALHATLQVQRSCQIVSSIHVST